MAHLSLRRLITEIESGIVTGTSSSCLLQEAIGKTSPLLMSSLSILTNRPTVSAIRSWIYIYIYIYINSARCFRLLWSLINACYFYFILFRCPLGTWLPVTMRMWVCSVTILFSISCLVTTKPCNRFSLSIVSRRWMVSLYMRWPHPRNQIQREMVLPYLQAPPTVPLVSFVLVKVALLSFLSNMDICMSLWLLRLVGGDDIFFGTFSSRRISIFIAIMSCFIQSRINPSFANTKCYSLPSPVTMN